MLSSISAVSSAAANEVPHEGSDQASFLGHLCLRNVDSCWQRGTGHHLLHSTAALLLLYSAYCLPSIQVQGIQCSLHLQCPQHSGHFILWPCIFISLFPLSATWVGKFLAVFYAIITSLLNPVIYTLRNKEIRNAIKWLWWQTVDFCWYFIISNYQNVFCEHPKLATPILLFKIGKSFLIHI